MKLRQNLKSSVFGLTALALCATGAYAEEPGSGNYSDDQVHGSLTLYGWYPFLDGTVGVGGLGPVDIGSGSSDIFKILDGFFMGNGDVRYGKFGIFADILYADLSDSRTAAGWGFDGTVLTAMGTYNVIDEPEGLLQLAMGARFWWVNANVAILPPVGPSASSKSDWVDFIGGVRGKYHVSPKMFVEGNAFAGAGGSDFVWDVYGGFGYKFTEHFSGSLGYRGMGVDYTSGGTALDITFHGPVAALSLNF